MQAGVRVRLGAKGTAVEHVVFFPASNGTPAFRRLPSIEEAVRLVEHLRNIEGVSEVSVHALTEVPMSFRAYYRVELPLPPAVSPDLPVGLEPVVSEPFVSESFGMEPVVSEPVALEPEPGGEPVPALALVESLPVQGGEPEPERVTSHGASSLGFFA